MNRSRLMAVAASCALLCMAAIPLSAAVITVPGDAATIQAGIDQAVTDDVVEVADGIWSGAGNIDLDFGGKAITVRSANGPDGCIIDCQDAGRGFWFHSGENGMSILQGFTIANGADLVAGGGILCDNGSSPTITGNVITGCSVGASGLGGGISCYNGASPTVNGNTISFNTAYNGGGFYCDDLCNSFLVDNIITENNADSVGGGIYLRRDGFVVVEGNTISNNTASIGAGLYCWGLDELRIISNTISGNQCTNSSTGRGGGIRITHCTVLIDNNLILDNMAPYNAGGISTLHVGMTMTNNLIAGNTADTAGAMDFSNSVGSIRNCTIIANSSTNPEPFPAIDFDGSSVMIIQSIVWGNMPTSIDEEGTNPTVQYSDVEGGYPGTGNIDADPLFATGPGGDFYLSQVEAGQVGDSPCLDAGGYPAANVCYTEGDGGSTCLHWRSTRTDLMSDAGTADLGYHYPYHSAGAEISCIPGTGTLPLQTVFSVTMTNGYQSQARRLAGRLNITLADGTTISNWRGGYANIAPGDRLFSNWTQTIPALGSMVGDNQFSLVVADVTPSPYNQSPYPAAGDTATDACIVTGVAP